MELDLTRLSEFISPLLNKTLAPLNMMHISDKTEDEVERLYSDFKTNYIPLMDNTRAELPNKASNGIRYVTQYQQAVNMGVYASDMAYCCILGNSQNTLEYFNLVKNLSIEIGLYEGIDKDLADRVLNNLSETDTLLSVTSDSYHDVVNYIEEQGLVDIQCLVVAGAWIESLYLCLEPMKHQELNDETYELIHDHQVLLENLIELLDQNKQSANVAKLLDELKLIQSVYDVTYQNKSEKVTQEQFVNIVNTVCDVRARLII